MRRLTRVHDLDLGSQVVEQRPGSKPVDDHHVRTTQELQTPDGDQVGISRTAADERHPAARRAVGLRVPVRGHARTDHPARSCRMLVAAAPPGCRRWIRVESAHDESVRPVARKSRR